MQGDAAAHAVAEDVGFFDPEVLERGGDIIGHLLDGERAIYVRRAPMGLHLEGDNLPSLGKRGQKLSEGGADRRKGAVKEDQWLSGAVDLVIHLETVHWSVATSPQTPSVVTVDHSGYLLPWCSTSSYSSIRQ